MCGTGGDDYQPEKIANDKEPGSARVARDRLAGKTQLPKTVLTGPRGLDPDLYGKELFGQ